MPDLDDVGQTSPRGDPDLRLHDVDAGDRFGNRMLHLNAGVHFDEVQLAVLIHQELDGSRVGVADHAHRHL